MGKKDSSEATENDSLLANPPPPYSVTASGVQTPQGSTSASAPAPEASTSTAPAHTSVPIPAAAAAAAAAPPTVVVARSYLGPTPYHTLPAPSADSHRRAMRQADRRARSRFCGALFWGILIWMVASMLIGAVVDDQVRSGHHVVQKGWTEGRKVAGHAAHETGYWVSREAHVVWEWLKNAWHQAEHKWHQVS